VNHLLTISGKVNIPTAAESQYLERGCEMKKQLPARWSFWTWLLGGGQDNGGANG
jgi:hypothetical protein